MAEGVTVVGWILWILWEAFEAALLDPVTLEFRPERSRLASYVAGFVGRSR